MKNAVPTNVTSIVLIIVTSNLSINSENKIERNMIGLLYFALVFISDHTSICNSYY